MKSSWRIQKMWKVLCCLILVVFLIGCDSGKTRESVTDDNLVDPPEACKQAMVCMEHMATQYPELKEQCDSAQKLSQISKDKLSLQEKRCEAANREIKVFAVKNPELWPGACGGQGMTPTGEQQKQVKSSLNYILNLLGVGKWKIAMVNMQFAGRAALDGLLALSSIEMVAFEKGLVTSSVGTIEKVMKKSGSEYEFKDLSIKNIEGSGIPAEYTINRSELEQIISSGEYDLVFAEHYNCYEHAKYKNNSWDPDPPLKMDWTETYELYIPSKEIKQKFSYRLSYGEPSGYGGSVEKEQNANRLKMAEKRGKLQKVELDKIAGLLQEILDGEVLPDTWETWVGNKNIKKPEEVLPEVNMNLENKTIAMIEEPKEKIDAPLDTTHGLGFGTNANTIGDKKDGLKSRKKKIKSQVKIGSPKVIGVLDKKVISRVIKRHMNEIKYCYEKELVKSKNLKGKVVVAFTIGTTGTVASASIKSSTINNSKVEKCMVQKIKRWKFPSPGGGIVKVSYPFIFNTN